jgi:Holliday junction DNA helicase RuvB
VDARGLDAFDRNYIRLIAESFAGGPVGIETIAAALGESRDAIEEIVEPFLLQQGFVQRTPRGRVITSAAFGHLGLAPPPRDPAQIALFPSAGDDDG